VLPEISATDLHIAIIGQTATPYLLFGNTLKTGPLQVVRLHAFLGRHSAINKAAEDLARNANDALVFTDPDAELDHALHRVPVRIGREAKKHAWTIGRPVFSECSIMAVLD
jgi:hypothetical protein